MIARVKKELDELYTAKEHAFKAQRTIVPLCARAIRSIQQGRYSEAEAMRKKIETQIRKVETMLKHYPDVVNSILGTAYQEYAELSIFISYMKTKRLPKLDIPAKFYLLGLGDAIGELKRAGMELLADHKLDEAEKLYSELEDIYAEFSSYVYPGSVVPGLKQKQDAMRRVLNNFHDQILAHKLTRP